MPRAALPLAFAALALCARPAAASEIPETGAGARPLWAATVFGGVMLDNTWDEIFLDPAGLQFEGSGLVGVAVSREVWRPRRWLSGEIEGQLVRHVDGQTHWELNAPVATVRAQPFSGVDASAAFGVGISVASETPRLEVENEGDSQPVMAYWMIEVEAGLPAEDWRVVGRVHHRSTAYGLFGEDGGANALAIGLRRRF